MAAKFVIHVRPLVPSPVELGHVGETEGPIIDAIRNALSQLNIPLIEAQYGPTPMVFPPFYIVTATIAGNIPGSVFKDSLDEVWPGITDKEGNAVPPANIDVQDQ